MSKWIKILAVICIVIITGLVAFWYLGRGIIEDQLKAEILVVSESKGVSLSIGELQLESLYPLKLNFSNIQLKIASFIVKEIKSVGLDIQLKEPFWSSINSLKVKLFVDGALMEYSLKGEGKEKEKPNTGVAGEPAPLSIPIELEMAVSTSSLKVFDELKASVLSLDKINLGFQQEVLFAGTSPMKFDLKSILKTKAGGVNYKIPLSVASQETFFSNETISAKNVNVSFSGITMLFKEGVSNFKKNTHEWSTQFAMDDLGNLPQLPDFLPDGKWSGSIKGQVQFRKSGDYPPYIGVSIVTSPISG